MFKVLVVIAVLLVALVVLHEVGRNQGWESVQTIDQGFAKLSAQVSSGFQSLTH